MGEIVAEKSQAREITEKVRRIMLDKIYSREPPNRIWLSDTVYCGRKKIFRILGLGEAIPERAISRIWLGIVVGEALQGLGIARELPVEYRGIRGRIDVVTDTGEPIEVKTTINPYTLATNYTTAHTEQLSRYCLATGVETGILFYYLPGAEISEMPATRYRFNLTQVQDETDIRLNMLEKALAEQDPFTLPPTWHSKTFNNWECRQCNYRDLCMAKAKQTGLTI
jgi:CRISPR/Cas system-associated exonuclease Cas4 (RecB family)